MKAFKLVIAAVFVAGTFTAGTYYGRHLEKQDQERSRLFAEERERLKAKDPIETMLDSAVDPDHERADYERRLRSDEAARKHRAAKRAATKATQ
jgi:hypothetical protein